uniref:Transmembrane protein n=1 Tax=Ascaris lumbricoides TaxID=6252 RepID=A0A0M3IIE9_ASCLU
MPRSGGGLLMESDDSDVPDLDLPTASLRNKKSLFSNSRPTKDGVVNTRRYIFSVRCALVSLMISLVIAVAFLGFLSMHIMSQIKQLEGLVLLPRQLEILKRDVYRLKTDFDLLRISNMASSSSGSAWNATSFVSERLDVIESEVKAIAKEVKEHMGEPSIMEAINALSASFHLNFVFIVFKTRIDALDDRCSRGCESSFTNDSMTASPSNDVNIPSRSRAKDRVKKKRSKGMSTRDSPIVFTRAKD